ncbi:MAG: patatin-like phospholipase family protein [Clostridia bacterium]|nr:patatin-like phospholipase family protein [Clostridia bacterium]
MTYAANFSNLILSGGGIKGVAFVGALEVAEARGYRWANIGGVSAGALMASLIGAGYSAHELRRELEEFDFKNLKFEEIEKRVPVVAQYTRYSSEVRNYRGREIEAFFTMHIPQNRGNIEHDVQDFSGYRGSILKNIITYCKEGSLFDGDCLEEWVSKLLLKKGIRTFADLRGGLVDRVNPRGYKVRMTAVDANRGKVIVLPDEAAFYDIEPDSLEVAKAVRMSTCVPFAFKSVELTKKVDGKTKKYHIVDGGVLDNFPTWLLDASVGVPIVGFRLDGADQNKLLSMGTPLGTLKALISAVHDIGLPKYTYKGGYIVNISTSKVSFLDFDLDEQEKEYLYSEGKKSAELLFNAIRQRFMYLRRNNAILFNNIFRRRYF